MNTPEEKELGRRLKEYRKKTGMTQEEFARFVSVPYRTYQNYECGFRYPRNMAVVNRIARALNTTTECLLGEAGEYIVEAGEKGNISDQRRLAQMVTQMTAMFAGGELDEESRDAAMRALNDAYWKHKAHNKKLYTTKAAKAKKEAKAESDNVEQ